MNQKVHAAGALIFSKRTKRVLLLQKKDGKHAGKWGLVGGKNELHETSWDCLSRELKEEIGVNVKIVKVFPLEMFVSPDSQFSFITYFLLVDDEFLPYLSNEHTAWGWFSLYSLPKPLHQGLNACLNNKIVQAKLWTIMSILDQI